MCVSTPRMYLRSGYFLVYIYFISVSDKLALLAIKKTSKTEFTLSRYLTKEEESRAGSSKNVAAATNYHTTLSSYNGLTSGDPELSW